MKYRIIEVKRGEVVDYYKVQSFERIGSGLGFFSKPKIKAYRWVDLTTSEWTGTAHVPVAKKFKSVGEAEEYIHLKFGSVTENVIKEFDFTPAKDQNDSGTIQD